MSDTQLEGCGKPQGVHINPTSQQCPRQLKNSTQGSQQNRAGNRSGCDVQAIIEGKGVTTGPAGSLTNVLHRDSFPLTSLSPSGGQTAVASYAKPIVSTSQGSHCFEKACLWLEFQSIQKAALTCWMGGCTQCTHVMPWLGRSPSNLAPTVRWQSLEHANWYHVIGTVKTLGTYKGLERRTTLVSSGASYIARSDNGTDREQGGVDALRPWWSIYLGGVHLEWRRCNQRWLPGRLWVLRWSGPART